METVDVHASDNKAIAEGKKIRILPVSLFLLVPALYVFGKSYSSSWLAAYGLTSATFPLSVDQAIYNSYEATLLAGLPLMQVIANVGTLLLVFAALWAVSAFLLWLWMLVGNWLKRRVERFKNNFAEMLAKNKFAIEFTAKSYALGAAPLLLWGAALYLYLMLLIPLLLGHYIGKWQGEESFTDLKQRISSGKPKKGDQLIVLAGDRRTLHLVACSDLGCGGTDFAGSKFVRWDDIERIEEAKLLK